MMCDVSCLFQETQDDHIGRQNEFASAERRSVSEENNTILVSIGYKLHNGFSVMLSLLILYLIPSPLLILVNEETHFGLYWS